MSEVPTTARAHGFLAHTEDAVVGLAALGIAILPLADIVARQVFDSYVEGADAFAAHLTLLVGMFGAAIAARDGKLLSLATGALLPDRMRQGAAVFAALVGSAVATVLVFAGVTLIRIDREQALQVARGIPVWVVDLAFPIAFGLIALRPEWFHGISVWPIVGILIAAAVCGMPIFGLLGGLGVFLFMAQGDDPANAIINSYGQLVSEGVRAIPLFTIAGFLLAEGRSSERLLRLFRAFFGWMPGGTAVVTTALCAFFTTFTGASGVTILALAGLLMPILISAKYSEKAALGLLTGSGSLGLLFPPCLPMILYAIVANVKIEEIFLGGILPGCLLVGLTAWWGVRQGPKIAAEGRKVDWAEAGRAMWAAKWELLLPVVAMVALFGGFATPVEASAVTALYAFIVETFVYRDLSIRRGVPKVLAECGLVIGGVLMILGVAKGFTSYLIFADVPTSLMGWVTKTVHSPLVFLLILNLFLLLVGCLMDIFSAIVVVVPLIVPIGEHFQIDPVHLGIVFLANLELGYMMPPVGMNLLLASYRLKKPVTVIYRAALPMILVLLVGVLVITYVPVMTTFLPRIFQR